MIDIEYRVLELVPEENSITKFAYWTHVENEDNDYDFDKPEAERVFDEMVKQGRKPRLVEVTTKIIKEAE